MAAQHMTMAAQLMGGGAQRSPMNSFPHLLIVAGRQHTAASTMNLQSPPRDVCVTGAGISVLPAAAVPVQAAVSDLVGVVAQPLAVQHPLQLRAHERLPRRIVVPPRGEGRQQLGGHLRSKGRVGRRVGGEARFNVTHGIKWLYAGPAGGRRAQCRRCIVWVTKQSAAQRSTACLAVDLVHPQHRVRQELIAAAVGCGAGVGQQGGV